MTLSHKKIIWKKIVTATGLLLMILAVTSCTAIRDEDILGAPKLSLKYEEVSKLIEANIEGEYELVNPLYGNNSASVQFVDLNGDRQDEILLFYRLKSEDYTVRAAVFYKDVAGWHVDKSIRGIAFDVNRVEYADLNGDGHKEIIIGWQGGSLYKKGMSIYTFNKKGIKGIFDGTFTEMAVDDFTGDAVKDLMVVKTNRTSGVANATLYSGYKGEMKQLAQTEMDGYVSGYLSVKSGRVLQGFTGLLVDARHGDHSSFTDLLVYNGKDLINVFYDKKWKVTQATYRNEIRESKDINGDGIIDIPLLLRPVGYEASNAKEIPWITGWYDWYGGTTLGKVDESFENSESGYEFNVPQKIMGKYTLERNQGENDGVTIYLLDQDQRIPYLQILSMKREYYQKSSAVLSKDDYFALESTDDRVNLAKLYKGAETKGFEINQEDVGKLFTLINTK